MSNVENFPAGEFAPRNRAERRAAQHGRGHGRGRRVAGAALTAGSAAFAATAALAGPAAAPANAATTLHVTTTNDTGGGSLRDQVAAANPGDTIVFDVTGTITLTSGEIAFDKNLTISGPGATALTLSGNNASRVFHVTGDSAVTISGLTFIDGASTSNEIGGGAIASEGPLTLDSDAFHDNTADFGGSSGDDGGAVYVRDATTISNSTFTNNTAGDWGGAILATSINGGSPAPVSVTGSTFAGNQGHGYGGGLAVEEMATATVTGSSFTGNTTDDGGGLSFFQMNGPVAVGSTTVSGNSANGNGGGIALYQIEGSVSLDGASVTGNTGQAGGGVFADYLHGGLDIANSTISGNQATDGHGGGLYAGYTYSSVNVSNTTIADNTASGDGGGVQLWGDNNEQTVSVTDSTISGNNAAGGGGGGWIEWGVAGPTTFANTTVSGNTAADEGGGLYFYGSSGVNVEMSTITGNTSGESTGGIFLYTEEQIKGASGGHHGHEASAASSDHTNSAGAPAGGGHKNANGKAGAAATPSAEVTGSIVWGNSGDDIGQFADVTLSHDLLGNIANGIVQTDAGGNLFGVDPELGPLQNNGGATETHALLPGSPAIDAGPDPVPDFPGNEFDQRGAGYARIVGTTSDIGAFEVQPPAPEAIVITPKFTG